MYFDFLILNFIVPVVCIIVFGIWLSIVSLMLVIMLLGDRILFNITYIKIYQYINSTEKCIGKEHNTRIIFIIYLNNIKAYLTVNILLDKNLKCTEW